MADREELTQTAAAKRLTISTRELRKLDGREVAGDPLPRLESGLYAWPDLQKWYVAFKQHERERRQRRQRGAGTPLNLQDEQARHTAARADIAELELAELRKLMFNFRDMAPLVRLPLERTLGSLRNGPARFAPTLAAAAEISVPVAMKILEDIVEEIVAELQKAMEAVDGDSAARPT
jgi:hypothetical protein